jgi:type IV secretion system protein VirB2
MRKKYIALGLLVGIMFLPYTAHAQVAGGFKWETVFSRIVASLTGPMAGMIAVIAIVIFGLGLALSEGGAIRVVLGILLGLSIAASAPSLAGSLFGFAI